MERGQKINSHQNGSNLSERMIYLNNITRYNAVMCLTSVKDCVIYFIIFNIVLIHGINTCAFP